MKRILIAGMGNVLQHDDGFGVEVARLLQQDSLPPGVTVIEVGIGGIHLVQELMTGYDMVLIVDAMERGSAPGTIHLLAADVDNLSEWSDHERQDFLADMHYTTPSKALVLAKALGALPPKAFILGCQPADVTEVGIGLSEPVAQAVPAALEQIKEIMRRNAPAVVGNGEA
ncbi:MAG: hydrogenase maturation protease [Herpetosiphon sp.]